ncbi:hypothetical protein VARIO8X_110274 [Burkholderiales bacterium 8X]|nr:hypothetical protein VARIO8X_110274 [Burkholderiales bacterium 8X]
MGSVRADSTGPLTTLDSLQWPHPSVGFGAFSLECGAFATQFGKFFLLLSGRFLVGEH